MSCIYIIRNTVNKKCYVGQSINAFSERFKKHLSQIKSKNRCSALYDAFIKYGKDKFYIELIIDGDFSKKELNDLEVFYINHYKSLSPKGYNLQSGGGSFLMCKKSNNKISKALKGRIITWKEKVSEGMKKRWEDPVYRAHQTKQRYEKRGKYRTGIKREKLKIKVDLIMLKKQYLSGVKIKDICTYFKISVPTIYRIIKENNICKRRG